MIIFSVLLLFISTNAIKVHTSPDQIPPADIGKYLSQARQNPKSLIPYLQQQLNSFKNGYQIPLKPNYYYSTQEGVSAWKQAINFLQNQKPIQGLKLHSGLTKAASDHAQDLADHNLMGHVGSDGSTMSQRIERYSSYNSGSIGENVAQEFTLQGRNHALETILSLIIDDGVADRGHRKSIFNSAFNYYGSASRLSGSKIITVIDYASDNLPSAGTSSSTKIQVKSPLINTNVNIPQIKSTLGVGKKYVVGTSTQTSTSIVNGKKTIKTVVKTTYSDGSTSTSTNTKTTS